MWLFLVCNILKDSSHLEQVPCSIDRLELAARVHPTTHAWVNGDDHELPSVSVLEWVVSEYRRSGSHPTWPNQLPCVDLEKEGSEDQKRAASDGLELLRWCGLGDALATWSAISFPRPVDRGSSHVDCRSPER